jgi:hypothetical protein
VLTCAKQPVAVKHGVANFSCSIHGAGSGYTLTATSSGYVPAVTTTFNVGK